MLIERYSMENAMWMVFLLNFEDLIDIFIYIIRSLDLFIIAQHRSWRGTTFKALTAAAKSSIAFPAIRASSWLSLISRLMT